jgi:two-component system OmpR family response regulator
MPMEPSAHILVVDDHREIRDLLSKYLARHGFRVSAAESAVKARRLLETSAVDLVVLDVMMPGTGGLEVLAALREGSGTGTIPVVVLTAWTHAQQEALDAGARRFLSKPFDPDELKSIVDELLRAR